jgi:hypothetical protein
MAYVPDWERLSDALNRVVTAGVPEDEVKSDISRAIADGKIQVRLFAEMEVSASEAISSWNLTATLAAARGGRGSHPDAPSRPEPKKRRPKAHRRQRGENKRPIRCFEGANIKVPKLLSSTDFDWTNSRPTKPWLTGPREWHSERHSFAWRNRPVSLIEVRTADIITFIERAATKSTPTVTTMGQENAAIRALTEHLNSIPEPDRAALKRAEAEDWCRRRFTISQRGFQFRVWPQARKNAGLNPTAPSGRKRKSSR